MFEAIVDSDVLESLIAPVGRLVDECKLHLDEDGIRVRAVDPANVGMVDIHLDKTAFESYQADQTTIGVNLSRFKKIVGMANAGQLVRLDLDEAARDLDLRFGGVHYTLALIDPDSIRKEPDIPDLPLDAAATMDASEFRRAIRLADMVSEHVRLRVDPDAETFVVDAEGETDDVEIVLDREDLESLDPADAESLYSMDYIGDMSKAVANSDQVDLELGVEYPAKMHFSIGDGHGDATYMVAPRIQS